MVSFNPLKQLGEAFNTSFSQEKQGVSNALNKLRNLVELNQEVSSRRLAPVKGLQYRREQNQRKPPAPPPQHTGGGLGSILGLGQPSEDFDMMGLFGNMPGPPQPSPIDLQLIEASIRSQYDPQINAIRQFMDERKGRASQYDKDLSGMYGALQHETKESGKHISDLYGQTQQTTAGKYDELKNKIAQSYTDTKNAGQEVANRLGLSAALPETQQGLSADETFTQGLVGQQGQAAQDALGILKGSEESTWGKFGDISQSAGINARTDMKYTLEDLLKGSEGDIMKLQGSMQGDIMKALAEAGAQNYEQQNDYWDNSMDMWRLQNDMYKTLLQQRASKKDSSGGLKGLDLIEGSPHATDIVGSLMETLKNPDVRAGRYVANDMDRQTGKTTPMTPEQYAFMVVDQLRNSGVTDQGTLNLAMMMARQNYGR